VGRSAVPLSGSSLQGRVSRAFLKTSRGEILDPTVALPKGRIASIRAWRSLVIVALLLSIVSCGGAQHTDVSVD
jgi:hypothetical protein